ncbi:hypothetical protein PLESTB_001368600 [Pleodorina starrii]|uniref:U-box domain-containing protein n=1 Tax=Pleodorina starrii TaxID=330485 RepID=A0A9W6BUM8_9CHLO|nr:hypothetical protein PLESTM_000416400 [Pleodorina starrii]GLC58508.1 hypothetical protein PLESTB_001368600 [Pleodorina starrii]GLC74161.1 hypothetical protein PLESTF_001468500 [Pleodorina starrii]
MGTSSSKSYKSSSMRYAAPPQYPPMPNAGAPQGAPQGTPQGGLAAFQSPTMRFRAIKDHYSTVGEVQDALRKGGLESSNLIVAVDFTKSNEWTGKNCFGGKSLHAIGDVPSPYEDAISAIGKTLSAFDDDGLIPCYGFGDATTGDRSVFSFLPGDKPCQGLEQVLWRYRELCPYVRMAGPTSFAPAIRQACRIVEQSGNQYHILLLVADGQVSRSSDLLPGQFSAQEQDTMDAIVEASYLPLSIIMVGVGDGPWDLMKDFDDALPQRQFDNFQFVNFTDVARSAPGDVTRREATFALRALMEIPEQYQIIQRQGLLSAQNSAARAGAPRRKVGNRPLDPPVPANVLSGLGSGGSKSAPYAGAAAAPRDSRAGPAGPTGSGSNAGKAGDKTGSQPDQMFLCPITQDVMQDPVIATDGYTYERSAITQWLQTKTVSPMTNAPMPGGATLIPNHALRSSILQWKQDHGLAK